MIRPIGFKIQSQCCNFDGFVKSHSRNRTTAVFIISSALFGNKYKPILKDYEALAKIN